MELLVLTGGTGFLGRAIAASLILKGIDVALIKRNDIVEIGQERFSLDDFLDDRINAYDTAYLIHAATQYVRLGDSYSGKSLLESNVLFPLRVIERIASKVGMKLLNLESYFQYPETLRYVDSAYVLSKRLFAKFLRDSGIPHINLVLYDTFGPSDTRSKITNLILQAMRTGENLTIKNPYYSMALTDVAVVVEGVEYVRQCKSLLYDGRALAIHQNSVLTISEIVEIAKMHGTLNVKYLEEKPDSSRDEIMLLPLPEGYCPSLQLKDSLFGYFSSCIEK